MLNGKFVKLNKFENRINLRELQKYCIRYAPVHVYMSVLGWLFPERVGKKYKGRYCVPIGGEYVVDVDAYALHRYHNHNPHRPICFECLEISKHAAIRISERLESYYSTIVATFSGRRGFHIHVIDFDIQDWTYYNERNPIKSHEAARYKLTRNLALDTPGFDRHHFTVSVDPMRVISVPLTLHYESGLICLYIGGKQDLEKRSIRSIINESNPISHCYPEPYVVMKSASA